jgi:hypothetical protein
MTSNTTQEIIEKASKKGMISYVMNSYINPTSYIIDNAIKLCESQAQEHILSILDEIKQVNTLNQQIQNEYNQLENINNTPITSLVFNQKKLTNEFISIKQKFDINVLELSNIIMYTKIQIKHIDIIIENLRKSKEVIQNHEILKTYTNIIQENIDKFQQDINNIPQINILNENITIQFKYEIYADIIECICVILVILITILLILYNQK